MKILVLSASPNNYATRSIVKAGERRGHTMVVKDPAFLYLLISDAIAGYDRIYDGKDQLNNPVRPQMNTFLLSISEHYYPQRLTFVKRQ